MEVTQDENISGEIPKDPIPLSVEGEQAHQMELDTKPKPSDKPTKVSFKDRTAIEKILKTPKETGSSDIIDTATTDDKPSSKIGGKDETNEILSRLEGETPSEKAKDDNPPTEEESKETAATIIDLFDGLFMLFIEIFSKDPDDSGYKVESEKKTALKRHLANLLQIAGKKYPVAWLFVGLVLLAYGPIIQKAWKHRKMVNEQKEKDKAIANNSSGGSKTRKRKTQRVNNEVEYYPAEEVR